MFTYLFLAAMVIAFLLVPWVFRIHEDPQPPIKSWGLDWDDD